MIVLDSTVKTLEIVLGGAVSTNQLPFVAVYVDVTTTAYTPIESDGASNNTTAVTMVAAPAASTQRQIKFLSVQNEDTANATVILQYNDNGTIRRICKFTLSPDDTLLYTDGEGMRVLDSTGSLKQSSSGSPVSSISIASANGFAGSSSGGTAPVLTLTTSVTGILKGNGTAISAASASDITGQLLTGYVSGAGVLAATDTILQGFNKLNGNIAALVTGVSSVSGTASRITSTGGATPVIDISASYVGQSSITTLGTIGTGTWQGTVIGKTYGGTGVNIATTALTLGTASSAAGSIVLQNATNANTLTINSGVTSASYSLTLPTAQGGANTYLKNDGAGVLSWGAVSSGLTIGGTGITSGADYRVLFQDATASDFVTQIANFTMGSVASGYLDVPTGYALGGSKLIKYNEYGIGGLSFGIGADPTGAGFFYHNLAIGVNAVASAGNSGIAIGYGSTTTAAGQLVIGSSGDPMSSVYIGSGVTAASPSSITYNATGGSGSNVAGASLTLAGGKSTGSAAGGSLLFKTSTTLGSGTTAQSLVTRLTISGGAVTTDASTATWADALDHVLGTTTGTKWGTSTSQKQAWYNATPVVQQTTAVATSAFVANTSGIVDDSATFGGYKISQIAKAMQIYGFLA